ncbi:MAG: uroporphyrinogen decarboxylase family protein [Anaerolineae bacterium]
MMTSRQVVDALLRKKPAERVGLMDSPWGDTIAQWVRQGYPTRMVHKEVGEERWNPEDGRQVDVERAGEYLEPVPPFEHFDYDLAGVGPWFDIMPLRDHSVVETETAEWEVRRNGAGAALKYWKHKSGTPEHIDFRMVTREIWERDYRPHLLQLDVQRLDLDKVRESMRDPAKADKWTHMGNMFIWELMRQSMGDVTMYESLVLDPAWVHDYCQVYTAFYQQHFTHLFAQVGLPCGVWLYEDLGYKNGLFASPKVLRELVFPYYRQMVDFFHGYDLPVILHSCGSTAEALPLVVDAGFDAINPMERKALNNEPFAFAERYGDRLAFVGGLDARVFESNDRDLIKQEVAGYIEGMKARGARLVFASDHSISPNTRYDSYRYALDVYREHMMY